MCIRSTLILYAKKSLARFGPTLRIPLACAFIVLLGTSEAHAGMQAEGEVRLTGLRDAALAWHIPPRVELIRGARLLADAPRPAFRAAASVRSIVRSNPRLSPIDALLLATSARLQAEREGIDPDFFVAAILQESAFSPYAVSAAGALGIAQFTYDTAQIYGVDPLDPQSALAGSARLFASYIIAYRPHYPDPYAAALAAYNAGPEAVERYHGVPPYAETRGYVDDVYDRWARIERDRSAAPVRSSGARGTKRLGPTHRRPDGMRTY